VENGSMRRIWFLIASIVFVASLVVQIVLERMHKIDSIGVWYTAYSALIYTVLALIVLALACAIARSIGLLARVIGKIRR